MFLTIALEPPTTPEVINLIEALDAYQTPLYPPTSHHLLDLNSLAGPAVRFFVARLNTEAVGCGALKLDAGYGEIKRMFVHPKARGQKVAKRLLTHIEDQARADQLSCLRLETGIRQLEAIRLYKSAGYVECGPFGLYQPDPLSVFMEKHLG
jgi:putative acetyltransferase